MPNYHVAQLNVAHLKAPLDSPQLVDFVDNLDRINAMADKSPGFVWRLQTPEGDATSLDYFGSEIIANLSVWSTIQDLHNYVYRSAHIEIMRRKQEWFHRVKDAAMVLWWIPVDHMPTLKESNKRLVQLQQEGPTQQAFTFKKQFEAPVIQPTTCL